MKGHLTCNDADFLPDKEEAAHLLDEGVTSRQVV